MKTNVIERDRETGAPTVIRCNACRARIEVDGYDVQCGCGREYNGAGQEIAAGGHGCGCDCNGCCSG